MKRLILIFYILLSFNVCFAQMVVQNRDVKQPAETKLFISGNHITPDFSDASDSNNQITKYADAKTVNETSTTNPKYFPVGNDKGIYFDGTGDYLSLAHETDMDFGTADFTIDLWFYSKVKASIYTFFSYNGTEPVNSGRLMLRNDNNIRLLIGASYQDFAYTWATNTWYHLACVRSSNVISLYLNGSKIGDDFEYSNTIHFGTSTRIASYYDDSYNFSGFLQNIRVSKGIARWTSNFTPPALNSTYETDEYTKLYIKGHDKAVNTTAMTDDSGTSKTITTAGDTKVGYSRGITAYFDGTGDYLLLPSSTDFDFSTASFTVEFWVQMPTVANSKWFWAASNFSVFYNNGIILGVNGGSQSTGHTLSNNTWAHIAVVKTSAGNTIVYKNGVASTNIAANQNAGSGVMSLGAFTDGGYASKCYVQGLRVSKGIARYTSNFTPPETEPAADQYTKLLLKQNMLRIQDIATDKAITIYGQTMNRNFAKVGKNSIYFDGIDDYLSVAFPSGFAALNQDFTVDFWAYLSSNANAVYMPWASLTPSSDATTRFYWRPQGTKYIDGDFFNDLLPSTGGNSLQINKWNHFACVRNNNIFKTYLNGVSTGVTATNSAADARTTLYIGTYYTGYYDWEGYLQDLRFTQGKALWTANFTPPRRSGAY